MTKLRSLKPTLSTLRPLVGRGEGRQAYDRDRDRQAWRGWYKTARWQKLRWSVLKRDAFTCQWPGCGRVEGNTSLLVADHRQAHRGDEALFWSVANLWTLCKSCHDSLKQREERRGAPRSKV